MCPASSFPPAARIARVRGPMQPMARPAPCRRPVVFAEAVSVRRAVAACAAIGMQRENLRQEPSCRAVGRGWPEALKINAFLVACTKMVQQ